MSTAENIDAVHDLILSDRQNGLECITEPLGISYERNCSCRFGLEK